MNSSAVQCRDLGIDITALILSSSNSMALNGRYCAEVPLWKLLTLARTLCSPQQQQQQQ